MKHFRFCISCLFIVLLGTGTLYAQPSLREQFITPPIEAKPWTFWYWMYGAVSKEGIKADLEAMKEIGLGGAYLMTIKSIDEGPGYKNAVAQLTPEWWEIIRYSMEQADRLNLKLGMHISDGFALAGGPWITPKESMQKVVWNDTIVSGGKAGSVILAKPESFNGYYEDIAVYALPLKGSISVQSEKPVISSNNPDNPAPFSGIEKVFRSEIPCWIQYQYSKPITLRSLEVFPSGNNFQAQRLCVMASEDGVSFHLVKQLVPARQGWQNTDSNYTYALSATTARYFRLSWNPQGSEPGSEDLDAAKWKPTLKIKQVLLSSTPRINQWEGKAGLVWRVANKTTSDEITDNDCSKVSEVLNLTSSMKDGVLTTKLPKGNWRILRMGHTSTGHTNATGGAAKGLECDKFSETAVQKQFDNWFGAAFAKTDSALAHRVLKFMHIDSWECGSQNWSKSFASEFKVRRGYDLMPYLPLLAGYPIESADKSEKVLLDVRTTISDLVSDVFFKVMEKNAKAYGCETSAECVAPTFVSDGMLHFKEIDRPMGEFWLRSPTHDKPNDMLDAISGAHIYGKNIIQSESFTQLRINWDEHPAMLKPILDRNFALGINKVFFHIFVHNPYMDRAPGMTLDGIGHYFQRDQTWWQPGKAFVDYVARCQAMLQYGHPVTDIAVFTGEEVPRRALTPDKLVPYLSGIMGKERVDNEQKRLANVNQPMLEMPAGVNHSANIFKAEDWVNPLNGYAYDSFNKDALLHMTKGENGRMLLMSGSSYNVLLLPYQPHIFPDSLPYSYEVNQKIKELKKNGVSVISNRIINTNDLSFYGVTQDVIVPENIAWTHRTGNEGDVYFISNQENKERQIEVTLRCSKKVPSQWNPVNGDISYLENLKVTDKGTNFMLTLAPFESTFIVFFNRDIKSNRFVQLPPIDSLKINSDWEIEFVKNQQHLVAKKLFDWSKQDNPLIKYYSGTAIYKTSFNSSFDSSYISKIILPIYLNLGKVCNLATVRLNGVDCGTAWTAPYQVDISKALKEGVNTLEIEVTNTWANAINGSDKGMPPFPGIWTNAKYRMTEDKLLEAGLLGPISIIQKQAKPITK
ncbi:MAG: glycosyl hydrolase [Paludibacter sp.]|nr:glycosyl hydrolase [Paludibacter sp.]